MAYGISVCHFYLSLYSLYEIASDSRNKLQRVASYFLGESIDGTEGFKAKVALIFYIVKSVNKSFPIGIELISPWVCLGVGHHMKVVWSIIIVNMKYSQAVAKESNILIEISSHKICVSHVKTNLKSVAALVTYAYYFLCPWNDGGADVFVLCVWMEHILNTAIYVIFFKSRNVSAVKLNFLTEVMTVESDLDAATLDTAVVAAGKAFSSKVSISRL